MQKYIVYNVYYKCLSVCNLTYINVGPSVHALTLVNILQMSLNLYMLFISDIEWTVVKMVCMGLRVRLQIYTNVFRYIKAYGGKDFWNVFQHIALDVMKLTCVIQIYKNMFLMKNGLNCMNILYTGSHKSFPIHYGLWGRGIFKGYFSKLILL